MRVPSPSTPHAPGRRVLPLALAALLMLVSALAPVAPAAAATAPATGTTTTAPSTSAASPAVPAGFPVPDARAWLLADADTGEILAAHGLHRRYAPASTLKTLSALALSPGQPDSKRVVANADDANQDGTRVGLVPGSDYSVSDVLHGMLMTSGNDTAHLLGRTAGSIPRATATMTRAAQLLGLTDTVAHNTSGLDAPGQVSSVHDLAILGVGVIDTPRLAKIVLTPTYRFPDRGHGALGKGSKRKHYQIASHDSLLGKYPGVLGVKNGYTVAAHGSFIGAARRDGRRLVAVVLRAEYPTSQAAAKMLDWGFAHPSARPVGRLALPSRADWATLARSGVTGLAAAHAAATASPTAGAGAGGAARVAAAGDTRATTGSPLASGLRVAGWTVAVLLAAVVVLRIRAVRRSRRRRAHRRARAETRGH